ncbi:hypothetical protein N7490_007023 [Penicillium lividum]|nr:hypothetical protein N7490_007023 [Penicillium lividum]
MSNQKNHYHVIGGIIVQDTFSPLTNVVTRTSILSRWHCKYDLAVVGGTVSHTGIGGLILRGGYGYLTPQYGLAIDNLLAVKMVTANGRVVEVSANESPDLFWALRGAGPSVGIVTEFLLKAHPQPNIVWRSMRVYSCDLMPGIIQALNAALVHLQGRAAAQCLLSISPETRDPIVTTLLFFNGSKDEGERHFAGLLAYTREDKVTPTDMFGVNADHSIEIKAKYDEGNLFNKLNPLDEVGKDMP